MRNIKPFDIDPAFFSVEDRRAAALRMEREQEAMRLEELASQTSPMNDPIARVRIWEKLHALSLPVGADHPLLAVIAQQTQLSLATLREEQSRRHAPLNATGPAAPDHP